MSRLSINIVLWLTRYMAAEGDEGIFRHQFAVKLASYPLRVVFPEETGLSFLLRGEMLGKGDGGIVRHQFAVQFARYPFR